MSGSTKSVICVTACDRWIGFGIARALLLSQKRDSDYKIRAIGRDTRCMKKLEKLGAEVVQINYENRETLERACQGCVWTIMISEMDENRVNMAKTFADICRKASIPNMCFFSMLGADNAKEKGLRDFREMERCVESTDHHWTIMRVSFFHQRFHHFARRVSEEGVLALPIGFGDRIAPIHFDDLQRVLVHLLFHKDGTLIPRMDPEHREKHYVLTGPEVVDGEIMVNMLNKVLDLDDKGRIAFKEITREECEKYLKSSCEQANDTTTSLIGSLLQKFRQLWLGTPDNKGDEFKNGQGKDDNTEDLVPPHCPNDTEIMIILDFFDYIKEGKAGYVSGDVKRITGEEPKGLIHFFEHHRNEFDRHH